MARTQPGQPTGKPTVVTDGSWPKCVRNALTPALPDDVKNAPEENHGRANEQCDGDPYLDRIALRQKTSTKTRHEYHQGQ